MDSFEVVELIEDIETSRCPGKRFIIEDHGAKVLQNMMNLNDELFRSKFRMSKTTFQKLFETVIISNSILRSVLGSFLCLFAVLITQSGPWPGQGRARPEFLQKIFIGQPLARPGLLLATKILSSRPAGRPKPALAFIPGLSLGSFGRTFVRFGAKKLTLF